MFSFLFFLIIFLIVFFFFSYSIIGIVERHITIATYNIVFYLQCGNFQ